MLALARDLSSSIKVRGDSMPNFSSSDSKEDLTMSEFKMSLPKKSLMESGGGVRDTRRFSV